MGRCTPLAAKLFFFFFCSENKYVCLDGVDTCKVYSVLLVNFISLIGNKVLILSKINSVTHLFTLKNILKANNNPASNNNAIKAINPETRPVLTSFFSLFTEKIRV